MIDFLKKPRKPIPKKIVILSKYKFLRKPHKPIRKKLVIFCDTPQGPKYWSFSYYHYMLMLGANVRYFGSSNKVVWSEGKSRVDIYFYPYGDGEDRYNISRKLDDAKRITWREYDSIALARHGITDLASLISRGIITKEE